MVRCGSIEPVSAVHIVQLQFDDSPTERFEGRTFHDEFRYAARSKNRAATNSSELIAAQEKPGESRAKGLVWLQTSTLFFLLSSCFATVDDTKVFPPIA